MVLWVGTYPHTGLGTPAGTGEGVWRVLVDGEAGRFETLALELALPAPSFVVPHPSGRAVYAVSETAPGGLTAFRPGAGAASAVTVPSGGELPCHLLLHRDALYVSHYLDGSVTVHRVDEHGHLRDRGPVQVLGPAGTGPSHAHAAAVAPDGAHLLVADLGADSLRRLRLLEDGRLEDAGVAARFPAGTGPRHVAVGADGLLHVTGEVAGTLTTLRWHDVTASAEVIGTVELPGGTDGYPAHVVRYGGAVHASVRGPDVVVSVAADGAADRATRSVAAGGRWPRHFAPVGGRFVVAAERSHELVLLDAGGTVLDRAAIPSPACISVEVTK